MHRRPSGWCNNPCLSPTSEVGERLVQSSRLPRGLLRLILVCAVCCSGMWSLLQNIWLPAVFKTGIAMAKTGAVLWTGFVNYLCYPTVSLVYWANYRSRSQNEECVFSKSWTKLSLVRLCELLCEFLHRISKHRYPHPTWFTLTTLYPMTKSLSSAELGSPRSRYACNIAPIIT